MAVPLTADQAAVLRCGVSDVVPVVALLADIAEADRLAAAGVQALRADPVRRPAASRGAQKMIIAVNRG